MLNLSVNLQRAYENQGKEIGKALSKTIVLFEIDRHWKDHLRDMDDLKQSVQNASYEQKDPLLVYKFESFNLFSAMLESLNQDALSFLLRAGIALREEAPRPAAEAPKLNMNRMTTSRGWRRQWDVMILVLAGLVRSIRTVTEKRRNDGTE